jgi:hypothetical protein
VFFLVAMPLEWWLWKDAPFVQLGWQVVLGLSIVVAAVPWIGSVAHPADSAALRRHPARFAFVLPALALHLAIFALYGPYWRSGAGTAASPSTGWSRRASLRRCPPAGRSGRAHR